MLKSGFFTIAALAALTLVVPPEDVAAQGRSGGAPGWGHGGPSAGATFQTPFGRPSGGLTKSHTTGGWSAGTWGGGGQPGTMFETPSGRPSGNKTKTHTTGKQ